MKYLWTIRWRNPSTGRRYKVQTGYLPTRAAAWAWFLGAKPFMAMHPEDVKISYWQPSDL